LFDLIDCFIYNSFYILSKKWIIAIFIFVNIAADACFGAMLALPPIALAILRRILPSAPKR
jgi:hypothetical protein